MINKKPKVMVLLAAYNGMKWLDEQVDSILTQRDVDVKLVVSIDKSIDGTEEYIRSLSEKDNRVVLLQTGSRFGGAGPNFYRLICEADLSGVDYVSFADQDDVWHQDKLITSVESILNEGVSAFSSNVMAFWSDGRKELIDKAQDQRKWDFWFESAGPGCTFVLDITLFRSLQNFCVKNIKEILSFDLHDWFIYAFARVNGYRWFISPESTMEYRQHSGNQVGTNNNIRAYLKRIELVKKGHFRNQVYILQHLLGLRKSDPKVYKTGYFSNLLLFFKVFQLRRRTRDRIFLAVFILFGLF